MRGGTNGMTCIRSIVTLLAALATVAALAAPSGAYQRPGRTEVVSQGSDSLTCTGPGLYDAGWFLRVALDARARRVAFGSGHCDLVAGDTNGRPDVFVFDRTTSDIRRVSVTSSGQQVMSPPARGREGSYNASISANGRFVVFDSNAVGLVPNDTNLCRDVFIHDLRLGTTKLVSMDRDGNAPSRPLQSESPYAGGCDSYRASISADGRFVTYESWASDLVANDENQFRDVFLFDRRTRRTTLVTTGYDGSQVPATPPSEQNVGSLYYGASISASGRYIAYASHAPNLVKDDTNSQADVFVFDRKTGKTERVSVWSDGSQMTGHLRITNTCFSQSLSDNGRWVAFTAGRLVPNESSGGVYVYDRKTRRIQQATVDSVGQETDFMHSGGCFISGDGRVVGITVEIGGTKVAGQTLDQGDNHIAIHRRPTGATELVDRSSRGELGEDCDFPNTPALSFGSADRYGRYVAFVSCSQNLVARDPHPRWRDLFVRDIGPELGIGSYSGAPAQQSQAADTIEIETMSEILGRISEHDPVKDVTNLLTEQGANLYGASLAYRPQYDDLFAAIELEHMPHVLPGVVSPVFYGLRFKVVDKSYEVRATSLLGGTFGLFDCTDSPACTKIADLRGGYGTTGMRVVFSLPLDEVGLENGGELQRVSAFSALGTYAIGAGRILDTVTIK